MNNGWVHWWSIYNDADANDANDINDADTDDDAEVPGDLCRPVTKANLALVKFYKTCWKSVHNRCAAYPTHSDYNTTEIIQLNLIQLIIIHLR